VTGTLKPTDPLGPDNRRGQSYAINFEAGQTYVIDQRSKKFDAHLYLFDDNAKLVAQNDDFQGLDSRIRYTAPRGGTYTILAGTHNGALGDYTLVVRVERPAPPPHPRRVRIG
jgi:hypothetical protein